MHSRVSVRILRLNLSEFRLCQIIKSFIFPKYIMNDDHNTHSLENSPVQHHFWCMQPHKPQMRPVDSPIELIEDMALGGLTLQEFTQENESFTHSGHPSRGREVCGSWGSLEGESLEEQERVHKRCFYEAFGYCEEVPVKSGDIQLLQRGQRVRKVVKLC